MIKCVSPYVPRLSKSPSSDLPLATSSLAVGRFAAKQRSLRSPRGRLVASLICPQNWYLQAYIMPHWGEKDIQFCQNIHVPTGRSLRTADEGEATPGNTSGVRMLHWPRYRLHLENSRRSI